MNGGAVHLKCILSLNAHKKGLFNFRALTTIILKQSLTSYSLPLSRDEIPTFDVLRLVQLLRLFHALQTSQVLNFPT